MVNSNENLGRILSYQSDNHVFKSSSEYTSELVTHHRRKGVLNASFSVINNSYCVTSFNLMHNSQTESLAQTSLVIYDLSQGEVTFRITHANTKVKMTTNTLSVTQHPHYEKICVTTDIDGQIVFWDCSQGIALKMFIEHATIVGQPLEINAVSDCNFSKCGNMLLVGSNYGSFSLYGYGGSEFYEHVPVEQFSNTDYVQTTVMPDTYQIFSNDTGQEIGAHDEGTFFCNFDLTPHTNITESTSYENAKHIFDERSAAQRYRLLDLKKQDEVNSKFCYDIIKGERRKAAESRRKLKEAGLDRWPKQGLKRAEAPVEMDTAETVAQALQPAAAEQAISQMRIVEDPPTDSEEGERGLRRLRRRRASESSISEKDLDEEDEEMDNDDVFYDDEEGFIYSNRRSARLQRKRAGLRRNLRRSGRRRTGMNLRSCRNPEDRVAHRDIVENSEADSEEFYTGLKRVKKQENPKETPIIEEELFCTRCNKVGAREKCEGSNGACMRVYHRNCSDLCGADIRERFMCFFCVLNYYQSHPLQLDYSKKELDDGWLDIQSEDVDKMAPQIGDIYYFAFQPYEMFVTRFFDLLNFTSSEEIWPWQSYPEFQEREILCEVIDIQYEFPNIRGKKVFNELNSYLTIIMIITMRTKPKPGSIEEAKNFEIRYFPVEDTAPFLIWVTTYEKKVREFHHASNYSEFRCGSEYFILKEKCPLEDSFPNTLFRCIRSRPILDGISTRRRGQSAPDGETIFSPWEVEFQNLVIKMKKTDDIVETATDEEFALRDETKQKFTSFMKNHAKHCSAFIREVDKKIYPNYTEYVKVEMYLMKIYNRVVENYYRSLESLIHDIRLILVNANLFNSPNSIIVQQAKALGDYLESLLTNTLTRGDKQLKHLISIGQVDNSFQLEKEIQNQSLAEAKFQKKASTVEEQDQLRLRPQREVKATPKLPNYSDIEEEEGEEDSENMEEGRVQQSRAQRHSNRIKRNKSPPNVNGMMLRRRR